MSLIQVQDMSVEFHGHKVLSHVDLRVEPGEIVTIVGPNGSGKTSLFRAIIGSTKIASGRVIKAPGLRIGYVPQKLHIEPTLPITVERFLRLSGKISKSDCARALEVAGASHILGQQMSSLSGGQFQRALLARALINQPDLLMLDEATQGLDQAGSAAFYQQIETVRNETNCAVLMISHELHVVMAASDRVICLNGHVCCEGEPSAVATAPEYRALFGTGTGGALALYQHHHDHNHDHDHDHKHEAHEHA